MRDKPNYHAANARAQEGVPTVVRLPRRAERPLADGFSPADSAVTIRSCRVATLGTASAPTETNA